MQKNQENNKQTDLKWLDVLETAAFVLNEKGSFVCYNDQFSQLNAVFDFFRFQDNTFFTLNKIDSNQWYENLGLCLAKGASRFVVKSGFFDCVMSRIRIEKKPAVLVQLFESESEKNELSEVMIEEFKSLKVLGLTEMTASLAHEINNPLAIISARSALLQSHLLQNPSVEKIAADLQKISQQAERIKALVSGMNVFSKNIVGADEVSCSLRQLLLDAHRLVSHQLEESGVTFICHIEGDEQMLSCKPSEIIYVFNNVLTNSVHALKNIEDGRIVVELDEDEESYHLFFSDNGAGVPEALDFKIFKPFFSTKSSASGLGLSISNKILNSYGGGIRLARERGASCFQVSFKKTSAKSERKIS